MHQPGYIQGGQEVGRGYLLLGIHYRRIREHSTKGMKRFSVHIQLHKPIQIVFFKNF
jgi:hypothetical protein